MPDCPKCRSALIRRRNDFGVYWYCDACSGSAVTMSLLRKMIPSRAMNGLWQRARMGSYPRKHACPGCNRKMEEITVDAEGQTRAIDVCSACQFVWLDEGEWADLAFFAVDKATPEGMRDAVRERIAQKRREREAPPVRQPKPKPSLEAQQPPKLAEQPPKLVMPPTRMATPRPIAHSTKRVASSMEHIRARRASSESRSTRTAERMNSDRGNARRHEIREARRREKQEHDNAAKRRQRLEHSKHESGWNSGPTKSWHWLPALLGMPVEDEQPSGPRQVDEKPWFTWVLSGGILLVSLLAMFDLEAVVQAYGLIPAEFGRKGGLTWLVSFFLHGDLLHLLGNVYFLVIFGDNVEKCLGTLEFFLLLCLSSICGDFVHILLNPESTVPCIGASGGISGVLAFYALRFRHNQIAVMFWLIVKTYWLRMSAFWLFCIWVVLQCMLAGQQVVGLTNVSGGAHLGGALAGVFVWLIWRLNHGRRYSKEGGLGNA